MNEIENYLNTIAYKEMDKDIGEVCWYSKIDASFLAIFIAHDKEIDLFVEFLMKHGIEKLQCHDKSGNTASIGFGSKENKWYGWSHRAVYGFGIGSIVKKGCCGYEAERGEWTAETLDDAKQMACDFAESIS